MSAEITISPLAKAIAQKIRGRTREQGALTAPSIALLLRVQEREVRRVIADEYIAISREAGGLLLSSPGRGFYITSDTDEIVARHLLLKGLSTTAQDKVKTFEEAVRAFGLIGILNLPEDAAA